MGKFMNVSSNLGRTIVGRVKRGQAVLQRPLAETRGEQAAKILRFGTKGISAQFDAETEYRGTGYIGWQKGHDFGNRKAPAKTLKRSGNYKQAWLGKGKGAIEKYGDDYMVIGVDPGYYPQVKIHQGFRQQVVVKPKQRTSSGKDWKMRFFLGLTYGVWMSRERIARGFAIARRRVSVSSDVRNAIRRMVKAETLGAIRGYKTAIPAVKR